MLPAGERNRERRKSCGSRIPTAQLQRNTTEPFLLQLPRIAGGGESLELVRGRAFLESAGCEIAIEQNIRVEVMAEPVRETEARRIVISLHGIRTRGEWQKESLTRELGDAGFIHVPLDYGFFSSVRLVLPWSRRKQVDWFRDKYTQHARDGEVSIIAHSFGSYLVARAMQIYPEMVFDRIILCGSIVQRDYPWSKRIANGQCSGVLNDYGQVDIWARVAEYVVSDAGPSGVDGFTDEADGNVTQREHPEFRHSDYFFELNYRKNWIPFLQGKPPESLTRADRPYVNWKFRILVLILVVVVLTAIGWFGWVIAAKIRNSADGEPSANFPMEEAALLAPPKEAALAEPPTLPSEVKFTYRNQTNEDLKLLFFCCHLHYDPGNPPRTPWFEARLPANSEDYVPKFDRPSGWFLFFVREEHDSEWHYLGKYDLYSYSRPILTILPGNWINPFDEKFQASFSSMRSE